MLLYQWSLNFSSFYFLSPNSNNSICHPQIVSCIIFINSDKLSVKLKGKLGTHPCVIFLISTKKQNRRLGIKAPIASPAIVASTIDHPPWNQPFHLIHWGK